MSSESRRKITGPLYLTSKAGFLAYDHANVWKNGKPFYEYKKAGKIKFNLPPGKYFVHGEIERQNTPFAYSFKKNREREKEHLSAPKTVKVVFRDNPNKASIFLDEGIVILDNKFKEADECLLKYILYHEIGHYFYKSEHFCDEYAQERMLNEGYNKSQILKASAESLGFNNHRNGKCVVNVLNAKMK